LIVIQQSVVTELCSTTVYIPLICSIVERNAGYCDRYYSSMVSVYVTK